MLDIYKESQKAAYNLLMNEIDNERISHAYLIQENNFSDSLGFVMSFIKEIVCKNLSSEEAKVLSKRIDDNNYPDIVVIRPDGISIKKNQIMDLQKNFSKSSFEGGRQFYVVVDADKLRLEAANSMLKFLEEPNSSIVAILMTNNFENMLSTIVSRCQIVKLFNDQSICFDKDLLKIVVDFISYIEHNGLRSIIKENELLFDRINVKDRECFFKFFTIIRELYYDAIRVKCKSNTVKFDEYYEFLSFVASKHDYDYFNDIIGYVTEIVDSIKLNLNVNLLVDSFIVKIGG